MGVCSNQSLCDLDLLLQQKFINLFRFGYIERDGITMPVRYEDLREEIEKFEVFDDDVWVCSFPKTGTTWSQEMIWLIGNNFDYKGAEENICARFPFLEVSLVFDWRKLQEANPNFTPPVFMDKSLQFVSKLKRPRYIKTHLPWSLLPKQIRNYEKRPKIIYVTRNPKDVCVSYYHHSKIIEGFTGNFEEFSQLFLAGKVIFGPFWKNVRPFWEKRHEDNMLFIKYEDLKQNLSNVVSDVAKFFNKEISNEHRAKLLKHLSFEEMKTNVAVNYEFLTTFLRKEKLIKAEGAFMRSGKKENHKAEMSEPISKQFDLWLKDADPNNEFKYY